MAAWRFVICTGCGAASSPLEAAIGQVCPQVPVARAPCLSVCAEPVTLAVQGRGLASYVFSGLTADDAADCAAFARAYQAAPTGWIEDARPLGRLRFRLVTRLPAMPDA